MINSPVLDTAIGLVFIFLLYSLLTTSINEAIATLFSLRARMLKKGIIEGMLTDSKREKWIVDSTIKAVWNPIKELFYLIVGFRPKEKPSLGQNFYNHPIIKNYGSNDRFTLPSYIPKENFSTILIEVLKGYYEEYESDIEVYVANDLKDKVDLTTATSITRIAYLIKYLKSINNKKNISPQQQLINEKKKEQFKAKGIHIDSETIDILALHLEKSYQNLAEFEQKLQGWFDDSMHRVSGWYKRQTQFILFFLGLAIAITFNVDIIDIAGKLSTDKDARDKLVEMAIKETDELKNNPLIKQKQTEVISLEAEKKAAKDDIEKNEVSEKIKIKKSELDTILEDINDKKLKIEKMLKGNISDANNLLSLGWGDYGMRKDSAHIANKYSCELKPLISEARKQLKPKLKPENIKDSTRIYNRAAMLTLYDKHWIRFKVGHILESSLRGKKILGFLLLGFGVCLGAPFWFDLLQKLIKIRSAGKKENGDNNHTESTTQPVQVTVNNNTNPQPVG